MLEHPIKPFKSQQYGSRNRQIDKKWVKERIQKYILVYKRI